MQERVLTLTFDDGLIRGASKVAQLLGRLRARATFYLVTDWVRPSRVRIREMWNQGLDHGSWADWRDLAAEGHDIGSHTASHLNAAGKKARLFPFLLERELRRSHEALCDHIGQAPASLAMPFNSWHARADRSARQMYRAVRLGGSTPIANQINRMDWHRLASWAPLAGTPVDDICAQVASLAPGEWLILQWHSVDDEGYEPIPSSALESIVSHARTVPGLLVLTVRDVVEQYQERQT